MCTVGLKLTVFWFGHIGVLDTQGVIGRGPYGSTADDGGGIW